MWKAFLRAIPLAVERQRLRYVLFELEGVEKPDYHLHWGVTVLWLWNENYSDKGRSTHFTLGSDDTPHC